MLALADGAGNQVARFDYDAFGRERSATGAQAGLPASTGGDFRYHGQWQDRATGLYYVRASARTFLGKPRQLNALINFAERNTYGRTALLVTLTGKGKAQLVRKLTSEMAENGVVALLVTIRD